MTPRNLQLTHEEATTMKDAGSLELELRASIVPQQVRWPRPDVEVSLKGDTPTATGLHWAKLHAVVDEARARVAEAYKLMDEIDHNSDLSREGKDRQRRKAAAEAIADFERSKTMQRARESVTRVLAQWDTKVGLVVRPAVDISEASVHAQIRDRLAGMKNGRMDFLIRNAGNPAVASAVLTAPPFLSGLNDTEVAAMKQRVEQHVSPEITEAKGATMKAMGEAEQGWRRAMDKIIERGGLKPLTN